METKLEKAYTSRECGSLRHAIRLLSADEWIEAHASGTLRKSKRLGFCWRELYLEERTAYEWGWEFRIISRSRVAFGDAYIEGDTHELTEACWHIERYMSLNQFPDSDEIEAKYIYVESDEKFEGVGMILRTTSATWIPTAILRIYS